MSIFNVISLLGGLAMFLYGMRLMGDSLKAGSSGPLKKAMEMLTGTPVKAFFLGLAVTAIIQSSTATIVITAGLVAAGILTLHQSLGIIVGANVGTTVTGQIIRLLDLNSSGGTSVLEFFKPSTLAPLALIAGIILIMFCSFRNSNTIGNILVGFGVLFVGLMNMTAAVDVLSESGALGKVLVSFSDNPFLGYCAGAAVAFVLQSSSASVGILQAFATSGQLTFKAIYAVLTGIYLGDCVTTAIVCYIGAKPNTKRVATVNVLFNIGKMTLILVAVTLIHTFTGVLDNLWDAVMSSGDIANVNSLFNLVCAVLLLPVMGAFERMSHVINKDEPEKKMKYSEQLEALNPVFFSTPALALDNAKEALLVMLCAARTNIDKAIGVIYKFDEPAIADINAEEENIDIFADRISDYLVQLSGHLSEEQDLIRMDQYYKMVTEFERLGDHAVNLTETATTLYESGNELSGEALGEFSVLSELIGKVLDNAIMAFQYHDLSAAQRIEPLEEVVDDMVVALRDNHLSRLFEGRCSVITGTEFMNLANDIERISDVCSNIGVATVQSLQPELSNQAHGYISLLHSGRNEDFNSAYQDAHNEYFTKLKRMKQQDN